MVNGATSNVFTGKLNQILEYSAKAPLRYIINWGRIYSLWPVHLETACCSVEWGAVSGPRFDVERWGMLGAFGAMRQCDVLIILGTVNRKMAPRVKTIYDQMPEPRYVIAFGACSVSGGLYFDSYNVLPGVDTILPVDIYMSGCPPRPEQLLQALIMLQNKIRASKIRSKKYVRNTEN
ncbi:MAG TPA: NADH-quinone oxidoreductase subunit NuoB [Nitrososphaerales archaeon]|jgi:NADH-quinone oxidoreductase subunit B|nr:NADH-quinone oxidoreductase subunit NuoB [Nitrososphaerales archaeon]|tara:strand:- start:10821 stop:11354 length:534 start_codon:yes stop_codon:yes gene_type:complete